ncbi:MAG: hypothetical protein IPL46_18700 [Saprospiraceae bacterium]|nr:hypothetical protein [Saprospiraceae bacterium]
MKLELLHQYRSLFKEHLRSLPPYHGLGLKWECQEIFSQVWDLEALDLGSMFERALTHPSSGSLWGGNHQSAKSVMLDFIALNREFVRSMFRDLFSLQKDLSLRIERFHFHCDQLLDQVQQKDRRINHHFHEGYHMPMLYLSLRYPDHFCVYDKIPFCRSLALIGATNPDESTLARFVKIMPIYQSQLLQDVELLEILIRQINLRDRNLLKSLWLAYDFYHFIASQKR